MSERKKVYLAGPISKGDLASNIRQGTEAALRLLKAGLAPLCPQLTCYLGGPTPTVLVDGIPHQTWLDADLPWVAVSHAVLRLPGESVGADMETALAESLGIPVYTDIVRLIADRDQLGRSAGDPRFHAILKELSDLHSRKAHDYGQGVDPLANLRASRDFGVSPFLATLIRLHDKVTRLKSFAVKGRLENESVEDSLRDIGCYAILALILLQEEKEPKQ